MKKALTIGLIFLGTLTYAQTLSGVKEASATIMSKDVQTTYYRNYTGTVSISVADMQKLDTLTVHNKSVATSGYKVMGFDFTVVLDANTKAVTKTEKGNTLSAASKTLLGQIKSGSKVYVDNVVAGDAVGKTVKAPGITFNVQ